MQLLDELIQIKLTGISPKMEVCKISKGKESFQKAKENKKAGRTEGDKEQEERSPKGREDGGMDCKERNVAASGGGRGGHAQGQD